MVQKPHFVYIPFLVLILAALGVLIVFYRPKLNNNIVSTLSLGPTKQVNTKEHEPSVSSWTLYNNDVFDFSIMVPDKWNHQEYTLQPPLGGTIIAFSPDQLPCGTCSYFNNGFFSVRIYDQKSFPGGYSNFLQAMQYVGKDAHVQPVTINGKTGILFENKVSIENNGKIYEFSLDNNPQDKPVTSSKIYQRVVSSLKFTGLFDK